MIRLHAPSRRKFLLASGNLFAWAYLPKLARAEGRDPRFLTIVLRGALDGLATVAPVGDPDWVSLRDDNALTLDTKASALKLDDFFALNPAMPNLHRMFKATRRSSSTPPPRPIASARISTARTCSRPGFPGPVPRTAGGSTGRCHNSPRTNGSIRKEARHLPSAR